MNVEQLNEHYFIKEDMYDIVLKGISSKLITFRNGTIFLRVYIDHKWKKSHSATALEMANKWRKSFPEFKNAIACKIYLSDLSISEEYKLTDVFDTEIEVDSKKGILFNKNLLN